MLKKLAAAALAVLMCASMALAAAPDVEAPSALLMEKETGTVLAEKNAHERLPPASVTKVMSLLLFMEALDEGRISLQDSVVASKHASSMGGSQIWLKEGEQMTVHELLKAIVVASANDCTVALAEYLAGSEEAFVARMNERAKELSMQDTTFVNCTGLPAEGHLTSAWDIAIMARELIKHEKIKEYTTIWMDSLRGGAFQLANTNKLIKSYQGTTGLKTGSTDEARYCLAATAQRDGMELVAVILAAPTSDIRFASAKTLFDYGFSNFKLASVYPDEPLLPIPVKLGKTPEVQPVLESEERVLIDKAKAANVEKTVTLPQELEAPVKEGEVLGELTLTSGGETLATIPILASQDVEKLTFWDLFTRALAVLLMAA